MKLRHGPRHRVPSDSARSVEGAVAGWSGDRWRVRHLPPPSPSIDRFAIAALIAELIALVALVRVLNALFA